MEYFLQLTITCFLLISLYAYQEFFARLLYQKHRRNDFSGIAEFSTNNEQTINFLKTNAKRLQDLRRVCQEMRQNEELSFRTIKFSDYNNESYFKFQNFFNLDPKSIEKERFYTWQYHNDDDSNEFFWLMCLPPKHGVSNWQRAIIASIRNVTSEQIPQNWELYSILPRFNYLPTQRRNKFISQKMVQKILNKLEGKQNYTKRILLARHPIDRLYSAWADKFQNRSAAKPFHDAYLKFIPTKFYHLKPENHTCSFPDFIRYWLDTDKLPSGQKYLNPHWKTQEYQCMPCNSVNEFDYIVKTETSDVDNPELMKILYPDSVDADMVPKYKTHNANKEIETAEDQESFSMDKKKEDDKKNRWLPDDYELELRQRFEWEMKMFGYE